MSADGEITMFCHREYPRLVGTLSFYCRDVGTAEELAQEALTRAVERWDTVRGMESPGAWVHRVAMNLATSWMRRKAAERRALRRMHWSDDVQEPAVDEPAIREAVRSLPERQRRCVILRFYLGHSPESAAEIMGLSREAVASLTYRAVQKLRERLDSGELDWDDWTEQEPAR